MVDAPTKTANKRLYFLVSLWLEEREAIDAAPFWRGRVNEIPTTDDLQRSVHFEGLDTVPDAIAQLIRTRASVRE